MADEKNEKLQVNVDFTGFPELYREMEAVIEKEDTDRSKYIRRLVREDLARRKQMALPFEGAVVKKTKRLATAA